MNCNETTPLLHAYIDGELDLVRSLAVEDHLKNCPTCLAAQNGLRSLRSAMRTHNLTYQVPPNLRAQFETTVREETRPARKRSEPGEYWTWRWLTFGTSALAITVICLHFAGLTRPDALTNEIVDSHIRSLMNDHLVDVISSDQHTVKPWFDGKIDFAPEVKDYAALGFPLVGGRTDYINGHTVAALVYRHNKHIINVLIWPTDSSTTPATAARRGYNLIQRSIHGMRYCLVSDLNPKELGELGDLLAQ